MLGAGWVWVRGRWWVRKWGCLLTVLQLKSFAKKGRILHISAARGSGNVARFIAAENEHRQIEHALTEPGGRLLETSAYVLGTRRRRRSTSERAATPDDPPTQCPGHRPRRRDGRATRYVHPVSSLATVPNSASSRRTSDRVAMLERSRSTPGTNLGALEDGEARRGRGVLPRVSVGEPRCWRGHHHGPGAIRGGVGTRPGLSAWVTDAERLPDQAMGMWL